MSSAEMPQRSKARLFAGMAPCDGLVIGRDGDVAPVCRGCARRGDLSGEGSSAFAVTLAAAAELVNGHRWRCAFFVDPLAMEP